MIHRRNIIELIVLLVLSILLTVLFCVLNMIGADVVALLGNDFQYNLISTSAVLAGFLFTGVSILISTIDKERVQRLWDNNYLDNLYYSAFLGIFCYVLTIVFAYLTICLQKYENEVLAFLESMFVISGFFFSINCFRYLYKMMKLLKDSSTHSS